MTNQPAHARVRFSIIRQTASEHSAADDDPVIDRLAGCRSACTVARHRSPALAGTAVGGE